MTTATAVTPSTIAVIGNPNTGKSTLFSALTGVRTRTGNYPGVTVEKKVGWTFHRGQTLRLVDLPGTYSLAPRSRDELVSVEVLLGWQPDIGPVDGILCIVDAANLERNLYLVSQLLELGRPIVLVLNMWDVAQRRGVAIDVEELSRRLQIPVIPCEAHKRKNLTEVRRALLELSQQAIPQPPNLDWPESFVREVETLKRLCGDDVPTYLLRRGLVDAGGACEQRVSERYASLAPALQAARQRLAEQHLRLLAVEAQVRYSWVQRLLQGVIQHPTQRVQTFSDRVDDWLTHRFWGLLVFLLLMFIVFQAIYAWSEPLVGWIESGQSAVASYVAQGLSPGPLRSLIVDGIIAGVGSVIVFLPQIVVLFLFIALLEDCGYMARAAFLMDKLMSQIGLSGKSFVPLMSSFACAVPGIMATRVIENRRDRMITILIAPLMSCSARLPVYALLIGAFVPAVWWGGWLPLQGTVLFGMMVLGAFIAIPVAWILGQTLFPGETPPFVMELPSYKWPSLRTVFYRVYDRAVAFLARAGSLIFFTNVLVWAASYFPADHHALDHLQASLERQQHEWSQQLAEREELTARGEQRALSSDEQQRLAHLRQVLQPYDLALEKRQQLAQEALTASYLGRSGQALEPFVRPLGWDWRIGVGVLASFPAREVIISTLGTIYSLGQDVDAESSGLKAALQQATWPDGRPVFTLPVALSIMVFFALCMQCVSTLMVIYRETNHVGWSIFTFVYMTALAYGGAWLTTTLGTWLLH
ncbi:MAG: ferrous iron transport protein B [Planctomycetaceae bacterium]|nr:MAG: ferrous iron transport protein B [Planctomycetaceae bacterium]